MSRYQHDPLGTSTDPGDIARYLSRELSRIEGSINHLYSTIESQVLAETGVAQAGIVLADTSAQSLAVRLPPPDRRLPVTVIKTKAANIVTVRYSSINDSASATLSAAYQVKVFYPDARTGNYYTPA